ncbi:MAG TPA: diheme cytochrome c [Burkholderiales bacterium]|nr:diheme cytochrome c [Burkholderiales bacterium]
MKRATLMILSLIALPAFADDLRMPAKVNPAWKEECGSCHVAYPPSLLSAANWRQMMAGLDRHFGANAQLDPKVREDILAFLENNAARKEAKHSAASLRITDTPWFAKEHDEVPAGLWKYARVKSAANCGACHREAERGDYSERNIALPGYARRAEK